MRNCTIIAIGLLLSLYGGQATAQQGLKLGAFALPQFTGLYNLDDIEAAPEVYAFSPLWGMSGGVLVGYNFNDYFGVSLNAVYSQEGGAYTATDGLDVTTRYVDRLQYFKVPLMIGINSNPENRKAVFHLYAGAQVGFLTGAYSYHDNPALGNNIPDNITKFPGGRDIYESMSYSAVGEIGVDIKLPPDNFYLNLQLRGDYSLQDVENKAASYRVTNNGVTQSLKYWDLVREGIIRNNDTFAFTGGLLIGVTYIFPTGQ